MSTGDGISNWPRERVAILIPALNEEASITGVVRSVTSFGVVVVIDNASDDTTARLARDAGAHVVGEPRRGYGSACLAGIATLTEMTPAPEVVVFLDADASDDPSMIDRLVEPILSEEVDFVLASRMLGDREPGAMPPVAVFGNRLASWLMRTFWRAPYTDLGPFRAIRYARLLELEMKDRDYGWTIEMQLKALKHGLRIREAPTPYRRRVGQSKISGTIRGSIGAGTKILWTLARYGLSR